MKCYVLRWNRESFPAAKDNFELIWNDFNKDGKDGFLTWEISQWEDAHAGDMFIFLQTCSENDGILMIGKLVSEPYYRESAETGFKGHVADLQVLNLFERNPESKVLVAFQLENEFPEINWRDGICGELVDRFVADRLCIRIMDELMARDIWDENTFPNFFGIETIKK